MSDPVERERRRAYLAAYRADNADALAVGKRAWHLKSRFGITQDEFERLLKEQGNRCAICSRDDPAGRGWHVDHCHRTGRVRGLLCKPCNNGLGLLNDDPVLMRAAANYIEESRS
jgi:hypothetical protein